jgi:cytidylate kinase
MNYLYVDTGAMYRAATLIALREKISPQDSEKLVKAIEAHKIDLSDGDNETIALIDGEDVSLEIRTPELTAQIGPVCENPGVRELMGKLQRRIGEKGGAVLEGRDIGTVIFPDAEVKIYLDATPEERAKRRWLQLREKGIETNYDKVLTELKNRDKRDKGRKIAPLKAADDAAAIDTTNMTIDGVVKEIVNKIHHWLRSKGN